MSPVLTSPPDPVTVARLKGTLDFYVWRGIPVCRTWPRNRRVPRSTAEIAASTDFGDNATALSAIPLDLIVAAQTITAGTRWTWRDLWTAAIYGTLWYDENTQPQPEASPMLPHISQRYYSAPTSDAALTTIVLATGTMHGIFFLVPTTTAYDQLAWEVTATTGGNDRLAIYGPVTTDPALAPLILDTGNQAIGSTGVKTFALTLDLSPGWYVLMHQNSTNRTYRGIPIASLLDQAGFGTAGLFRQGIRPELVQSYGAFPLDLSGGLSYQPNVIPPAIWLRAA